METSTQNKHPSSSTFISLSPLFLKRPLARHLLLKVLIHNTSLSISSLSESNLSSSLLHLFLVSHITFWMYFYICFFSWIVLNINLCIIQALMLVNVNTSESSIFIPFLCSPTIRMPVERLFHGTLRPTMPYMGSFFFFFPVQYKYCRK